MVYKGNYGGKQRKRKCNKKVRFCEDSALNERPCISYA